MARVVLAAVVACACAELVIAQPGPDSPAATSGAQTAAGAGSPKTAPTASQNARWQVWPAAGAASEEQNAGSHSWIAVPVLDVSDGRDPWRLVHVPPRRTLAGDGMAHGAGDGVLRPSIVLNSRPLAIAAVGSAVYVVFPTRGEPESDSREVVSITTFPSGVADLWVDEPAGAAAPEPPIKPIKPITGKSAFLGFAGTPIGPSVLLREDGTTVIRVLYRGEWRPVPIAAAALVELDQARGESVRLLQSDQGLKVVCIDPAGEVGVWDVALDPESGTRNTAAAEPAARAGESRGGWKTGRSAWLKGLRGSNADDISVSAAWTRTSAMLPHELSDERLFATLRIVSTGGQLLTAHRELDGDVLVGVLGERTWRALTRVEDVPADFALVPLDGLGRAAMVWSAADAAPQETGSALMSRRASMGTHLEVCEISAWTGRVLFRGPAGRSGLVGAGEFRLLAVAMLGLMAVVLTLIVRRDEEEQVFALPDGVALCEPGRRAIAGAIDLILVFILAARLMGISPLQFFMPGVLLSGMSVSIILLTALLGATIGTLTEAMFARSPGKLLVGCEVLAVVAVGGKPPNVWGSVWRAAVRNAVKWGLPPLGVFGVLDPSGRHRGDHIAGTLVVVRFDPDEEEDAQE